MNKNHKFYYSKYQDFYVSFIPSSPCVTSLRKSLEISSTLISFLMYVLQSSQFLKISLSGKYWSESRPTNDMEGMQFDFILLVLFP